jgi:hypothetical protein
LQRGTWCGGGKFIEGDNDVCSDGFLSGDGGLGSEEEFASVPVGTEEDPLFADF